MNVALFHTTLPEPARKLGGVEVAVHRLANALSTVHSSGKITVYSLSPKPESALYEHRQLFPRHTWLKTNRAARLLLLPILLNFVDFTDQDVIHFHGDDWFYFARKAPTVRTMHGSARNEARTAASLQRKLMQRLIYPLEHLSVRLARHSLAVGAETAAIYNTDGIADNGVDPDVFYPGTKTEKPSLIFIGTWEGRKRGRFVYDSFVSQVLPRVSDAVLYFISDTCPEHPQVVSQEFPSDQALAKLYREAWVFAYASVYEGFGIPYLEALASGTPVVCTPNSGASYVLEDGKYGEFADDAVFADKIIGLLENADRRRELTSAGLERAADFKWSAVARKHLDLYMGLSAPLKVCSQDLVDTNQ